MFGSKRFPTVLLAAAYGAVANGAAVFGRLWTARRHRRVVSTLLAFDDHMLRDIGVTRGDVAACLALPPLRDPSTRLRILAVERRAAGRAQRREVMDAVRDTGTATVSPPSAQNSPA